MRLNPFVLAILLVTILVLQGCSATQSPSIILVRGICSSNDDRADWASGVAEVLVENLDFADDKSDRQSPRILEYGYSPDGWSQIYSPGDTLSSIDKSVKNLSSIYEDYPEEEFVIIAHSLGGVVALRALALDLETGGGDVSDRTKAIFAISSPVFGLDETQTALGRLLIAITACNSELLTRGNSVLDDLSSNSSTVKSLQRSDWGETKVTLVHNRADRLIDFNYRLVPPSVRTVCVDLRNNGSVLNHDAPLRDENFTLAMIDEVISNEDRLPIC